MPLQLLLAVISSGDSAIILVGEMQEGQSTFIPKIRTLAQPHAFWVMLYQTGDHKAKLQERNTMCITPKAQRGH